MEKPSWEWDEDDLLKLKLAEAQESLNLEFKGSAALSKDDSKKTDISKDISAFANSAGGDIIYAVLEFGGRPSRFGDIDEGIDASVITP